MKSFRELVLERTAHMSLPAMAELLGVSKPYASQLRSGVRGGGRRGLSPTVARRALQLWPSLTDAYLRELLAEGGEPTDAAAKSEAVA